MDQVTAPGGTIWVTMDGTDLIRNSLDDFLWRFFFQLTTCLDHLLFFFSPLLITRRKQKLNVGEKLVSSSPYSNGKLSPTLLFFIFFSPQSTLSSLFIFIFFICYVFAFSVSPIFPCWFQPPSVLFFFFFLFDGPVRSVFRFGLTATFYCGCGNGQPIDSNCWKKEKKKEYGYFSCPLLCLSGPNNIPGRTILWTEGDAKSKEKKISMANGWRISTNLFFGWPSWLVLSWERRCTDCNQIDVPFFLSFIILSCFYLPFACR